MECALTRALRAGTAGKSMAPAAAPTAAASVSPPRKRAPGLAGEEGDSGWMPKNRFLDSRREKCGHGGPESN